MKVAVFELDDNLTGLLPSSRRTNTLEYRFNGPQTVKHLLESLGIPHTEAGVIRANAEISSLNYLVQDGDRIQVGVSALAADMSEEPRFVIDAHLGRLTSGLRMLGLDCAYWIDAADDALVRAANSEDRILLTRDRRLLMRKTVTRGYLVRNLEPTAQLAELVDRYRLRRWIHPFQRCIRCNQLLEPVPKESIDHRLEPLTRRYFNEFHICPSCRQLYWKGSHYDRMVELIATLSP